MSFEENKAWPHVQNSVSGSQGVDQWRWNCVRMVNMIMSKSRLCGVNILFAWACRCTLGWKKAQGDPIPAGLRNFYRKALLTTSTAATLKMHWLLTTIPPATSVPTTTELTPTAWDGFTRWMSQWMFHYHVRRLSTWPVLNSPPFQLIYNTTLSKPAVLSYRLFSAVWAEEIVSGRCGSFTLSFGNPRRQKLLIYLKILLTPEWTLNCAYTTNTRLYRPLSSPPSLRSCSMFWLFMSSFQHIIGSEPATTLLHIFAPKFPPGFSCHLSRKETEGLVEKAYSAMRSLRKVFWRTMCREGQMTQVLRVDWVENWRLGLGMRVMRRKEWLEAEICGKMSVNSLACGQGTWTIEDPGHNPRRLMRRRRISRHKGT